MNIFIAGPRAVSMLSKEVKNRITNIISNNYTILLGDANGIDKAVQKYCYDNNYSNVKIFATNGKVRNNIGKWEVIKVEVSPGIKGFEYYAAKDFEMAKLSDFGFMIWNGKSKGTLNNMVNLVSFNKTCLIYFIPDKKFYTIKTFDDINCLIEKCDFEVKRIFDEIFDSNSQITMVI